MLKPVLDFDKRFYRLDALSRDDELGIVDAEVRRKITSSDVSNAVCAALKYGGNGFSVVLRGDGISKGVVDIEAYAKEARRWHGVDVKIRPRLMERLRASV